MAIKKLSPEQERLLNVMRKNAGTISKTSASGLFSQATIGSLLEKGLIRGDYSSGLYILCLSRGLYDCD